MNGKIVAYEILPLLDERDRLRAQVDRLIEAGDRMRWAYRHETSDLPTTATRDWAEWNAAVREWLEAKDA